VGVTEFRYGGVTLIVVDAFMLGVDVGEIGEEVAVTITVAVPVPTDEGDGVGVELGTGEGHCDRARSVRVDELS
jgi:hypothetical protein